MQKPKVVDNATAGLEFQDASTVTSRDGTVVRAEFLNDNFQNIFEIITNAGYTLIDNDISQLVKAQRGLYDATYTYNTSAIATQTVNDVVLGSDGEYYEAQSDGVIGDDPVGSVTGDWKNIEESAGEIIISTEEKQSPEFLPCLGVVCEEVEYPTLYGILKDHNLPKDKIADPASLPTGNAQGVSFSKDDTYMAVVHDISPYVTIYKRSGDTFTKLANPSTLPTGLGRGCDFSTNGDYLSVAHASSPYVTIYKRSGDTFTKLADPSTLPTGTGSAVDFSDNGRYLSVGHGGAPNITIYRRDADIFTKLTDPTVLPTGTSEGVSFRGSGLNMAVAHSVSPYLSAYKRSGDYFTKLADLSTLPTGNALGVDFSSGGDYMAVAHSTTPFVTIYKLTNVLTPQSDMGEVGLMTYIRTGE